MRANTFDDINQIVVDTNVYPEVSYSKIRGQLEVALQTIIMAERDTSAANKRKDKLHKEQEAKRLLGLRYWSSMAGGRGVDIIKLGDTRKELLKKWHPDKHLGNEEEAKEKYKDIVAAANFLGFDQAAYAAAKAAASGAGSSSDPL